MNEDRVIVRVREGGAEYGGAIGLVRKRRESIGLVRKRRESGNVQIR